MKQKRRIYIAIGCAIALIALVVAAFMLVKKPDDTDVTYPTVSDAAQAYALAIEAHNAQSSVSATISYIKEITIDGQVFRENAQQQLIYQNIGNDMFRASVEETLTTGTHTVKIAETYLDGQCFFTVADVPFQCQLTQEEYLSRYTPLIMIDASLYSYISGIQKNDDTVITFQNPIAPEAWAISEVNTLQQAEGTVYLNAEGQLTKSIYTLSYHTGHANVKYSVSVQLQSTPSDPIQKPKDNKNYTTLSYIDGPRMLEIASGHLMDCGDIQSNYLEQIQCQLFGDLRSTDISIKTDHTDGWFAQVDTIVSMENTGKSGVSSTKKQTEIFQDDRYRVLIDGVEASSAQEVSRNAMLSYCRDILVSTVILPDHITHASVTQTEDSIQIQFDASDAFAELLKSEALNALYQNDTILQDKTYQTEHVSCYLYLDANTLLPVASGYQLKGNYQVDGISYPLIHSTEQTYQLYTPQS